MKYLVNSINFSFFAHHHFLIHVKKNSSSVSRPWNIVSNAVLCQSPPGQKNYCQISYLPYTCQAYEKICLDSCCGNNGSTCAGVRGYFGCGSRGRSDVLVHAKPPQMPALPEANQHAGEHLPALPKRRGTDGKTGVPLPRNSLWKNCLRALPGIDRQERDSVPEMRTSSRAAKTGRNHAGPRHQKD